MSDRRVFGPGDNEPEDFPRLVDANGDTWYMDHGQRTWRGRDGWRSNRMRSCDPARTWWWLSMYQGPLTEVDCPRCGQDC